MTDWTGWADGDLAAEYDRRIAVVREAEAVLAAAWTAAGDLGNEIRRRRKVVDLSESEPAWSDQNLVAGSLAGWRKALAGWYETPLDSRVVLETFGPPCEHPASDGLLTVQRHRRV